MRIRKMLEPGILPTAWASSYFRESWLRARPLLGAVLATLLVPSPLIVPIQAQPATDATVKPTPACASDDHRAFDFWIGLQRRTGYRVNMQAAFCARNTRPKVAIAA